MRQDLKVEIHLLHLAVWNRTLEQFGQLENHVLTFVNELAQPQFRSVSSDGSSMKSSMMQNNGKIWEYIYDATKLEKNVIYYPYLTYSNKNGALSEYAVEIPCIKNENTQNYLDTSKWICNNSNEIMASKLSNGYYECGEGKEDEESSFCTAPTPYDYIGIVVPYFSLGFVAFAFSGWIFLKVASAFGIGIFSKMLHKTAVQDLPLGT